MRLLFVGFGNVGRRLAEILSSETEASAQLRRLGVAVIGITTGSKGSLVNPAGLNLRDALREAEHRNLFDPGGKDYSTMQSCEAVEKLNYDVLLELSPLNIERRGDPAASYCRSALSRGRHVVTANKGPLAFAYRELSGLARKRGCQLLYESTVMDGAPLFSLARFGLLGCRVIELDGILNSTANFILGRMEEGITLGESIRVARKEGFAEADPSHDLEGWDAAAKMCVLANVLMDADVDPLIVERQSFSSVSPERVRQALHRDFRVKQVCRAWLSAGKVHARVSLEELPCSHSFANVSGTGSILRIRTDAMAPILIGQETPTLDDTAYGVLNDLLFIAGCGK